MSLIRKLIIGACMTMLVFGAAAGEAIARTVTIEPSGEVTARSATGEGRSIQVTFESELGNVECNVTLRGTVARTATGQLVTLEPLTNALIGQITAGANTPCTNGAIVRLLFGAGLWQIYKLNVEPGGLLIGYALRVNILIDAGGGLLRCLIDTLFGFSYNNRGLLRIREIRALARRALSGGFCPSRLDFRGEFLLNPALIVTLRDR